MNDSPQRGNSFANGPPRPGDGNVWWHLVQAAHWWDLA